jgi:formylglycine-generating enzyme required for sulfatase activity
MLTDSGPAAMVKVFISYSHDDKRYCDQIKKSLAQLEQCGKSIDVWADHEIKAGEDWDESIKENLRQADIIIFLVSISFIASPYIKNKELAVGYERKEGGSAEIIPVLLTDSMWEQTALSRFQALPIDPSDKRSKPIEEWENKDKAYNSIARQIDERASNILKNRQAREQKLQDYKKKCQEFLSQSKDLELNIANKHSLNDLCEDLGIDKAEAEKAFEEAEKPFRVLKKNRERYLNTVKEYLSVGSDLSAAHTLKELKDRQLALKLEDGDISTLQPEIDRLADEQRAKEEEDRMIREEEAKRGPALIQLSADRGSLLRVGNGWQQKTERITVSGYELELAKGIAITMVQIPAGSFQMGSPATEAERSEDEGPQRRVQLQSFFLGQTPVTQAQWQAVASWPQVEMMLDPNPAFFEGANRPVENVNWVEAMEFCRRLSQRTKLDYTMPSEAQWEYACRAGSTTPFAFGETLTPDLANYDGNYTYGSGPKGQYRQQTTEVGSFPANAWGLQDMHGNVWEWCLDPWHDSYRGAPADGSAWTAGGGTARLLRGGSWASSPRTAVRPPASTASRTAAAATSVSASVASPRTNSLPLNPLHLYPLAVGAAGASFFPQVSRGSRSPC